MAQESWFELSRHSIYITKNDAINMSWYNSLLSLRTEKGLHTFDFSYNLDSMDKKLDIVESFISTPKSSPASGLFTNQLMSKHITNGQLTDMIVDPAFWPHNTQLTQEMVIITSYSWSPPGFINNNKSMLAILTNIGNVELFEMKQNKWNMVSNFSSFIKQHYQKSPPKRFEQLKETAWLLDTGAFCWASNLNDDKTCYFVTAQKNGIILFWLLNNQENDIEAKLVGEINNKTVEIISMLWIPLHSDNFLLVCSNILGQITVQSCYVEDGKIICKDTNILWTHSDRMLSKYLYYKKIDDKILFICDKHRHLLVQMIDQNCNVLSQFLTNVNDYRITNICNSCNGYYVTTVNGKAYKLDLNFKDNKLDVNLKLLEFKDSFPTYDLYGLSFTNNAVICIMAFVDRKLYCRKEPLKLEIIFFSTETNIDSAISRLLSNPTKTLTNHWDYIELLRYRSMKTRSLPALDYVQIYNDSCTDEYKLKVYLILTILYNNLLKMLRIRPGLLPEISIEKVKENILAIHATNIISKLYNLYMKKKELNSFEMECYIAAKKYKQYFDLKYKNDDKTQNIDSIDVSNVKYECQCCDEKLDGFSCKYRHLNMICSVTFTPIQSDTYLVCKCCGCIARPELNSEEMKCVFCDLYFIKSYSYL